MKRLEFWLFKKLLKRFALGVDQWELWKFEAKPGYRMYMTLSNGPMTGKDESHDWLK